MNALLLFGATGDLARRMLLPSLFGLDADGLLPPDTRIVATARSGLDTTAYCAVAATALSDHIDADRLVPGKIDAFLDRLTYVPLDATERAAFGRVAAAVGDADLSIFLSTAPSLFGSTIAGLASAGLAVPGGPPSRSRSLSVLI